MNGLSKVFSSFRGWSQTLHRLCMVRATICVTLAGLISTFCVGRPYYSCVILSSTTALLLDLRGLLIHVVFENEDTLYVLRS
jgi:hypothetical protein